MFHAPCWQVARVRPTRMSFSVLIDLCRWLHRCWNEQLVSISEINQKKHYLAFPPLYLCLLTNLGSPLQSSLPHKGPSVTVRVLLHSNGGCMGRPVAAGGAPALRDSRGLSFRSCRMPTREFCGTGGFRYSGIGRTRSPSTANCKTC